MKQLIYSLLQISLFTFGYLHTTTKVTLAQITPDNTINTQVERSGNISEITGGATTGNNLFHSFEQFSVPDGNEAFFNNANAIQNIFSRVTGGSISEINGLIRANGGANLFLINPAGIIFGENASLNLGGSFYGSTASSIIFPDGEFSAIAPEAEPILTVSVPIGLSFENNPEPIINRSLAGLEVAVGEDIFLVGGNIDFPGGKIFAPGGDVELAGLAAAGDIRIDADGSLSFPDAIEKADVTLSNAAEVNVRSGGGGSITVNARNLDLTRSQLRGGIAIDSGSIDTQAGDITLNVTDTINVDRESLILNQVLETGVGNAGEINITTTNLNLIEGGVIIASTLGQGNGGAIEITASDTISIAGERQNEFASGIYNQVGSSAVGDSGKIDITTSNLSLIDGGAVDASTGGRGNAGAIEINASDTIFIAGETQNGVRSGIFNQVNLGAIGNSEGINIKTSNLSLVRGGTVNASTFGQGNAGAIAINASDTISVEGVIQNALPIGIVSAVSETAVGNSEGINIKTSNLSLVRGGTVNASTFGQGNAGIIEIDASDTIFIEGNSGIGSISGVPQQPGLGDAGGITINTDRLILTDDAVISVLSIGLGNAGDLDITANSATLNNLSFLTVFAFPVLNPVKSGNITLEIVDRLILNNNSTISARAFEDADGGNLDIDAEFIFASPNQNNDIIASADRGTGGNISITSQGIFGLEERNSIPDNNTNDLDASSRLGIDGTVQINTPEVNLQKELELEGELISTEATIANSCLSRSSQQASFTVGGDARLPKSPDSDYSDLDFSLTGIGSLPLEQSEPPQSISWQQMAIPAAKMVTTEDGRVFLVAAPQNAASLFRKG